MMRAVTTGVAMFAVGLATGTGHLASLSTALRAQAPRVMEHRNVVVTVARIGGTTPAINVVAFRPVRSDPPASGLVTTSDVATSMAGTLPGVVYIPGWGARADDRVLPTRIAAQGYIVIAIDDIAHDEVDPVRAGPVAAGPAESPAEREARLAPISLAGPDGLERFKTIADLRVQLQSAKVIRLLDALEAARRARDPRFADLACGPVAVVGYSFGGSTALDLLHRDARVAAAVNLDGWVFGEAAYRATDKPYLAFSSTNSAPTMAIGAERRNVLAMDAISDRRQAEQLSVAKSRMIVLSGTLHGDYSDNLHGGGRWTEWRPWKAPLADPALTRARIDTEVLSFLDRNIKSHRRTASSAGGSSCHA